jgi:ABC-type molybdate transport system ATPase subunit
MGGSGRRYMAFVLQDDILFAHLTVLETLTYTVRAGPFAALMASLLTCATRPLSVSLCVRLACGWDWGR